MGRRDAVQFTRELAAEWTRLGARVTFEPGWETRGNGSSANYEGCIVHHTVAASSATNPMPSKDVLKNGRTGLPGPLCNSAGPWCDEGNPWIHVFSANPANHAGASGGKSMGPLPVTSLFNPRVWGHEIDYLGDRPMTKGQYKAAVIMARGVINVLGRSPEYARAHAETSVTGKWDPGYAPGKTIDMAEFRRNVAGISGATPAPPPVEDEEMRPKLYRLKGTPTVYLASPGRFVGINPDFLGTLTVMGEDYKFVDLPSQGHLDFARWYYESFLAPDVVELTDVQGDLDRLLADLPPTS